MDAPFGGFLGKENLVGKSIKSINLPFGHSSAPKFHLSSERGAYNSRFSRLYDSQKIGRFPIERRLYRARK